MIVGAGANIAVQVGDDGVLVVDTGAAAQSDKVLAAIKAAGRDKEIRWIVNTTSGRITPAATRRSSKAGRTVNGNLAAMVAHENVSAAHDQGQGARRRPARTTPTSRSPATSRSTASRSCSITTRRRRPTATRWSCSAARTSSSPATSSRLTTIRRSIAANGGTRAGHDRRAQPHPRRWRCRARCCRKAAPTSFPGHGRHQRRGRRRDVPRHAGDHPRPHQGHGREGDDAGAGARRRGRRSTTTAATAPTPARGRRRCSSRRSTTSSRHEARPCGCCDAPRREARGLLWCSGALGASCRCASC